MALLLVCDAFVPRDAFAPRSLARSPRVRLSAVTGAEVDDVIDKLMELPGYEVPGAVAKRRDAWADAFNEFLSAGE